jgi:hypothetical protein
MPREFGSGCSHAGALGGEAIRQFPLPGGLVEIDAMVVTLDVAGRMLAAREASLA